MRLIWVRGDFRWERKVLGRAKYASIMAHISSHQNECIFGCSSQAAYVPYGVSWTIEQVKRAITKVVKCWELPNAQSIGPLETNLTKPSSTIETKLVVV